MDKKDTKLHKALQAALIPKKALDKIRQLEEENRQLRGEMQLLRQERVRKIAAQERSFTGKS